MGYPPSSGLIKSTLSLDRVMSTPCQEFVKASGLLSRRKSGQKIRRENPGTDGTYPDFSPMSPRKPGNVPSVPQFHFALPVLAVSSYSTTKLSVLAVVPPALVTETGPVVAPPGTVATTLPVFSTRKLALTPLNVTAVAPTK